MKRTYRLVVERTLVVEIESDAPESAVRARAAMAMIEDLARHPIDSAQVSVDALPDAQAAGKPEPDQRLR